MKSIFSILLAALFMAMANPSNAQQYSIVIKGGHVIDAKNNINAVMDVAVLDGKIAKVDKNIDTAGALQVVNAKGMYVTPGLIDIHGHVFSGTQQLTRSISVL